MVTDVTSHVNEKRKRGENKKKMLKSVTPAYHSLRSPTYAQGRDDKDAPMYTVS